MLGNTTFTFQLWLDLKFYLNLFFYGYINLIDSTEISDAKLQIYFLNAKIC